MVSFGQSLSNMAQQASTSYQLDRLRAIGNDPWPNYNNLTDGQRLQLFRTQFEKLGRNLHEVAQIKSNSTDPQVVDYAMLVERDLREARSTCQSGIARLSGSDSYHHGGGGNAAG